jgi:hypothetical protein
LPGCVPQTVACTSDQALAVDVFEPAGSVEVVVTVALLLPIKPPVSGAVTLMVIVAVCPLVIVPRVQVTGPDPAQLPRVVEALTKVTPAGSVSVTVTPVAVEGPLFWAWMVYVSVPPGATGSGVANFAISTSAMAGDSRTPMMVQRRFALRVQLIGVEPAAPARPLTAPWRSSFVPPVLVL